MIVSLRGLICNCRISCSVNIVYIAVVSLRGLISNYHITYNINAVYATAVRTASLIVVFFSSSFYSSIHLGVQSQSGRLLSSSRPCPLVVRLFVTFLWLAPRKLPRRDRAREGGRSRSRGGRAWKAEGSRSRSGARACSIKLRSCAYCVVRRSRSWPSQRAGRPSASAARSLNLSSRATSGRGARKRSGSLTLTSSPSTSAGSATSRRRGCWSGRRLSGSRLFSGAALRGSGGTTRWMTSDKTNLHSTRMPWRRCWIA